MDEKDLTKEVLIEVAKDLSKIFEQPIETEDDKTDMDLLKKDLIEAGNELQEGDNLTDESKDVLITLGVKLPWPVEAKVETKKKSAGPVESKKATQKAKAKSVDKKKSVEKKGKGKPASEKKTISKKAEKAKPVEKEAKEKTKKYTRSDALIDAFKMGGGTKQELIVAANVIYKDKGGQDNLNVAKALLGYVMPSLLILGIVIKAENGKYQLVDK